MWPYFSQVKRVPAVGSGICLRHNLHTQSPFRKFAPIYSFYQVSLGKIEVLCLHRSRFGICKIPDALHAFKMKFYKETLIVCTDKRKCMTAKTMHEAIAVRGPSVRHQDHDLVQAF